MSINAVDDVIQILEFVNDSISGGIGRYGIEKAFGALGFGEFHATKFHLVERAFGLGDKEDVAHSSVLKYNRPVGSVVPDWAIVFLACAAALRR